MRSNADFYGDLRYCPSCGGYVRYLRAWEKSYCVQCRSIVRIFSEEDLAWFRRDSSERDPSTILSRARKYDEAS